MLAEPDPVDGQISFRPRRLGHGKPRSRRAPPTPAQSGARGPTTTAWRDRRYRRAWAVPAKRALVLSAWLGNGAAPPFAAITRNLTEQEHAPEHTATAAAGTDWNALDNEASAPWCDAFSKRNARANCATPSAACAGPRSTLVPQTVAKAGWRRGWPTRIRRHGPVARKAHHLHRAGALGRGPRADMGITMVGPLLIQ